MVYFASTYAEVYSITKGPPLHDPLAVAAALYPEIFDDNDGERFQVDIVTEGVHSYIPEKVGELGRTKAMKLPPGEGGCRIPRGVDLPKFWESIELCLRRADEATPLPAISRDELVKLGLI